MCAKFGERSFNLNLTTHTGIGWFRCPRYPQFYTTKWAMDLYFEVHVNQKFKCPKCLCDINTEPTLCQHVRGHHGPGWLSPCGIKHSWPAKMFWHHHKCDKCKDIKEKRDSRATKLSNKITKEKQKNINRTMLSA